MRHAIAWPTLALGLLAASGGAQETEIRYLSGRGKDDAVAWEFFCTAGRGSGRWTTIPVPSNWELQGFGAYNYGHDAFKSTEQGRYRLRFEAPETWRGRKVALVFEGAMTDTEVNVNGRPAGPTHQGGFFRFSYDVGRLLELGGGNLLEVTVSKTSANESVNFAERCADYWIFGGIYRPVFLRVTPAESIERVAIDARADGSFRMDVHLDGIEAADAVEARIETLEGGAVSAPFRAGIEKGRPKVTLSTTVASPRTWSAETPHLYRAVVALKRGDGLVHRVAERFGFRTVEVRPGDGLYLNGTKVRLKGVNRHSFWPDAGRATSEAVSRADVELIKAMNMNAVRTSHYPPDTHFLEACDERGLYVIDELPGWQAPPYGTAIGEELVREMVTRDVNHPSVIFWSNGNEGGRNTELDDDFPLHDPQGRPVLSPYATLSHVFAPHYPDYAAVERALAGDTVYLPTEFLHGLYDGGAGAGLEDYWKLMTRSRLSAGGFLWAFADEAIRRTDRGGLLDTDGNHAPDGILGPYREKEGSFFTIREIWSDVQVPLEELPEGFDGRLPVENRYAFTSAEQCRFRFRLVRFRDPGGPGGHEVVHEAAAAAPSIPPGGTGTLVLDLPAAWRQLDGLLLTAWGPDGRELHTWSWMIKRPAEIRRRLVSEGSERATGREEEEQIVLAAGGIDVAISKARGTLAGVRSRGRSITFDGPMLVGKNVAGWLEALDHGPAGSAYVVRARFGGNLKELVWRMEGSGWLKLEYRFWLPNRDDHADHDFYGLSFRYPEARVRGVQWLGRGPYRVWKNRMRGPTFDVWTKAWSATETGRNWDYPEFKGYHANLYWAVLRNQEQDFLIATDTDDLFLRLYTPSFEGAMQATAAFPPGDVSFLHGIAPIGMKFLGADRLGPQGGRHLVHGDFTGTLYFLFADPE